MAFPFYKPWAYLRGFPVSCYQVTTTKLHVQVENDLVNKNDKLRYDKLSSTMTPEISLRLDVLEIDSREVVSRKFEDQTRH